MDEYEHHVSMKIVPDDRYQPIAVDTGVLKEKKLPGETDSDLILRTIEKAECALVIGLESAIRLKKEIVMSGLGPEEMEIMAKRATSRLIEMETEKKTRNMETEQLTKSDEADATDEVKPNPEGDN